MLLSITLLPPSKFSVLAFIVIIVSLCSTSIGGALCQVATPAPSDISILPTDGVVVRVKPFTVILLTDVISERSPMMT